MHNHCKHNDCEHELKYCKCCDTVYCIKCNKEWKQNTYQTFPYYPVIQNPYYEPYVFPSYTITYSQSQREGL